MKNSHLVHYLTTSKLTSLLKQEMTPLPLLLRTPEIFWTLTETPFLNERCPTSATVISNLQPLVIYFISGSPVKLPLDLSSNCVQPPPRNKHRWHTPHFMAPREPWLSARATRSTLYAWKKLVLSKCHTSYEVWLQPLFQRGGQLPNDDMITKTSSSNTSAFDSVEMRPYKKRCAAKLSSSFNSMVKRTISSVFLPLNTDKPISSE